MRDIYDSIDKIKCMNTQMTYNADAYMNNIHTSIDSNIPASVADIDSAVQRESKDRIIHTLIEYIRYHAHESSKYHKTYMNNIKFISSHVDIIHHSVQKIDQFKYATADKIKLLLSSHDVIRMKMSSKISSMQKAIDGILKDLSLIHHAHRHTRDAISHYRSSLQHEKGRYDALYNDMNKAVQQHNAHIKEYNSNIQTLNNTISYNRQQYDLHIHTLQDNHKSRDARGGGSATNGKPKRVQSDSGQQVDMYGDDLCTILRIESRYDIVSEVKRRGEEYDKLKRGMDGLVSVVSSICEEERIAVRDIYEVELVNTDDIIHHVCSNLSDVIRRMCMGIKNNMMDNRSAGDNQTEREEDSINRVVCRSCRSENGLDNHRDIKLDERGVGPKNEFKERNSQKENDENPIESRLGLENNLTGKETSDQEKLIDQEGSKEPSNQELRLIELEKDNKDLHSKIREYLSVIQELQKKVESSCSTTDLISPENNTISSLHFNLHQLKHNRIDISIVKEVFSRFCNEVNQNQTEIFRRIDTRIGKVDEKFTQCYESLQSAMKLNKRKRRFRQLRVKSLYEKPADSKEKNVQEFCLRIRDLLIGVVKSSESDLEELYSSMERLVMEETWNHKYFLFI